MNTMTLSSRFRNLIATAIVSALASSLTSVCAAADGTEAPTAVVKYADLNLSTPQGAAALYGRIRWAAEIVCGTFTTPGLWSKMHACRNKAIAEAVTKVNEPELIAVYNAKNRVPLPANLLSQSR